MNQDPSTTQGQPGGSYPPAAPQPGPDPQQWQPAPPQHPTPPKKKKMSVGKTLLITLPAALIGLLLLVAIVPSSTDSAAPADTNAAAAPAEPKQQPEPKPAPEPEPAPQPEPAPLPDTGNDVESDSSYLTYDIFAMTYEQVGYPLEEIQTQSSCARAGVVTDGYMANAVLVFTCDYETMDLEYQLYEDRISQSSETWYVVKEANWAHYSTDKQYLTDWVAGFGAGTVETVS